MPIKIHHTKTHYYLAMDDMHFDEEGEALYGDIVRVIPLRAEEYETFVKLLIQIKAIDEAGKRIDNKAERIVWGSLDKLDKLV